MEAAECSAGDAGPSEQETTDQVFVRRLLAHQRQLRAYVLSLVLDRDADDEIVQETLLKLFERRAEYDWERSFRAWACTVAYYEVLTHRKRIMRNREEGNDAFLQTVTDRQASFDEMDSRHTALQSCMNKLDAQSRRLLDLTYQRSQPTAEVAAAVGRTVAATHTALCRIRRKLFDCVQRTLARDMLP